MIISMKLSAGNLILIILYRKIFAEIYTERKGEVMGSLDLILTAAALIVGVMLLTGHGEIFMKGGNADVRKKLYDEKKMEKGCGVALILIGIISGIDMFTTSLAAKIGYIVVLLVIVAGLVYYLKVKCKK